MKKVLSLILVSALAIFALVGCGQSTNVKETEQTQIDKAKNLINSFTTGDTTVAKALLTDDYIQHNLAYETGKDAILKAIEYLGSAKIKTTVNTVRAFEDGNYVFMQTVYNFAGAGEQVAFDIFRFENGKVAEHWDNLAAFAKPNPSGHTQVDGDLTIKDIEKTDENKKNSREFSL